VGLVVFIIVALVGVLAHQLRVSAAEILATNTTPPSWLSAEPARVSKTGDLPVNTVPYSKSIDCNEKTIVDPVYGTNFTNCSISTSAGPIVNGIYTDGVHPAGRVFQNLLQSYGDSQLMYWSTGETSIYPAIAKSQLVFSNSNLPGYNYVPAAPSRLLTSASGSIIYLDTFNMAYSNNGQWLVAIVTPYSLGGGGGIMVFDTKTYTGKYIAPLLTYSEIFSGNNTPGSSNLAISDDGRYVAAGYTQVAQNAKEKGLRVYDTTTCTDQYSEPVATRSYCSYKNVWTGKLGGVTKTSIGIQEQLPQNVERPLNVRFKDVNTITFSGVYDYVSMTDMKAATYEATMAPAPPPPIKLLALGDSYISGEGAFSYISGTDTSNNKCHQSSLSYPYLLGAQYATEYHSVACSGAVMGNVYSTDADFPNQLINHKAQTSYNQNEIDAILNVHTPGTIEQYRFMDKDKPNVILLSIGGNDISFADIVERCVISFSWDPCYHKQSERKSLLLTIYSKFTALKATYSKILSEAPGARLYVMGYPQVINQTGNCGANVHFDDSERQFASLLIDRLNSTVKSAAESAGAVYVDVNNALVGHRLCDAHDDGVNGLTNGDDKFTIGGWLGTNSLSFGLGNESYHPTALGHQLISNAVAQQTDDLTKQSAGAISVLLPKIQDNDIFITTGAADDAPVRRIEQQQIVDKNIVSAGDKVTLSLGISDSDVEKGSSYQVVFHSDEVNVASGTLPDSANLHLNITVPKLTPGIHSVHVYTTDVSGEKVDIAEDIYVVASGDDFDGDGIQNSEDPSPLINETDHVITPKNTDEDGVPINTTNTQETEDVQVSPTTVTQATINPIIVDQIAETAGTVLEGSESGVIQKSAEVLGTIDNRESNVASAKPDKNVKHSTAKGYFFIGSLITSGAVAIVGTINFKRSKKQSGKM